LISSTKKKKMFSHFVTLLYRIDISSRGGLLHCDAV